jgi:serine/threonine protein kinase
VQPIEVSIQFGGNRQVVVLDSFLSSGGMGEVYRGRLIGPDRFEKPVAIKKILKKHGADPDFRKRFFAEAKQSASINHPGVIQTFAYGADESNDLYIVMELFDWPNLRVLMDRTIDDGKKIEAEVARKIIYGVAEALNAVHSGPVGRGDVAGIVHGDLSPENILVDSSWRVKILDFGISVPRGRVKQRDKQPGKWLYLAPEILTGNAPSPSSDLFSLGLIAFELLFGFHPFDDGSNASIEERILNGPQWPDDPATPGDLKKLVQSLLEYSPSARPKSAEAVLTELGTPKPTTHAKNTYETLSDARGNRIPLSPWIGRKSLVSIAMVVTISASIAWAFWKSNHVSMNGGDAIPRLTLFTNARWVDMGPSKGSDELTAFQLEMGKRLYPSACNEACLSSFGTLSIILGTAKLPDSEFLKSGVSLHRLIESIRRVAGTIDSKDSQCLKEACGNSPTCMELFDAGPWLKGAIPEAQQKATEGKVSSIDELRSLLARLDAGGHEAVKLQSRLEKITSANIENQPLTKKMNADLFGVSALLGIDLIEAELPNGPLLQTCQQIGDEFFARKLDPMSNNFVPSSENRIPELRTLIFPRLHNLNVTDSKDKKEIVFSWINPATAAVSPIFTHGLCYYSRKGSKLRRVIHWVPNITEIGTPSR